MNEMLPFFCKVFNFAKLLKLMLVVIIGMMQYNAREVCISIVVFTGW